MMGSRGRKLIRSVPPPAARGPRPPGTPRAAPDSQSRHAVDALHGAALAVGALLMASARSALGVPSRLPRSAFWIAKRMILQVGAAWFGLH
jgi:hypothetical protein